MKPPRHQAATGSGAACAAKAVNARRVRGAMPARSSAGGSLQCSRCIVPRASSASAVQCPERLSVDVAAYQVEAFGAGAAQEVGQVAGLAVRRAEVPVGDDCLRNSRMARACRSTRTRKLRAACRAGVSAR